MKQRTLGFRVALVGVGLGVAAAILAGMFQASTTLFYFAYGLAIVGFVTAAVGVAIHFFHFFEDRSKR